MLSTRLVEMIEKHSDEIVGHVLEEVHRDNRLRRFGELPDSLLRRRFESVCGHLSEWLAESKDRELERHFEALGRERFKEEIPLHEVVHAAHIFKRRLTEYAREHCCEQTAFELYAEGELERLLNSFFDRTVFHIVRGYEEALAGEIGSEGRRLTRLSREVAAS